MEIERRLERTFGGTWFRIAFLPVLPSSLDPETVIEGTRFCEALDKARVHPVLLKPEQGPCLGTRFAFGHRGNLAATMVRKLSKEKGLSKSFAEQLVRQSPSFEEPLQGVGLNLDTKPDLYLSPLQPLHAMVLLQRYEKIMEKTVDQKFSSIFSICANVAVKAHQTQDIALSFGCEDGRTFGRFSRDRLFVGLPWELATKLI